METNRRRLEAMRMTFADIQRQANRKPVFNKQSKTILPKINENAFKVRQMPKIQKKIIEQPHFEREPYIVPSVKDITPDWFRKDEEVDVSIIVPMYRSKQEIVEQIQSWDKENDGLNKEIIYVSDCCPQKSENEVMNRWYGKTGQILLLNQNTGYPTSCNVGARAAKGKYLIFLNADTRVTKNWVKPMIDLLEYDAKIGIVGNLQLKSDGNIDSAGSQWMWDNKSFEHIGRNVYQGKRLTTMMHLNTAPKDLFEVGEREMVTGCCFAIEKKLFQEINEFDIGYRIGYWEDSDLNMKVREKGYKVYYQPGSRIYHKSGHSNAGMHPFVMDNVRRFYDKWVNNHKIDAFVTKRP